MFRPPSPTDASDFSPSVARPGLGLRETLVMNAEIGSVAWIAGFVGWDERQRIWLNHLKDTDLCGD